MANRERKPVHLRNCRYATSELMAELGGWWAGSTAQSGHRGLDDFHMKLTRRCIRARFMGVRAGTDVRIATRNRLELVAKHQGMAWTGTFDPQWLMRIESERLLGTLLVWDRAGYRFRLHHEIDPEWFAEMVNGLGRGWWPVPYCRRNPDTKELVCVGLMADVGHPAYQEWEVEEVLAGLEMTAADGVMVGMKMGWFGQGPNGILTPEGMVFPDKPPNPDNRGPSNITPNPYSGPVSFEVGMQTILQELLARGASAILVHRPAHFLPKADKDPWWYLDDTLREGLVGEAFTPDWRDPKR